MRRWGNHSCSYIRAFDHCTNRWELKYIAKGWAFRSHRIQSRTSRIQRGRLKYCCVCPHPSRKKSICWVRIWSPLRTTLNSRIIQEHTSTKRPFKLCMPSPFPKRNMYFNQSYAGFHENKAFCHFLLSCRKRCVEMYPLTSGSKVEFESEAHCERHWAVTTIGILRINITSLTKSAVNAADTCV